MDTIYYCYEKETGKFAGSGTPNIQNTTHSCTEIIPDFESDPEIDWDKVFFGGEIWEIR